MKPFVEKLVRIGNTYFCDAVLYPDEGGLCYCEVEATKHYILKEERITYWAEAGEPLLKNLLHHRCENHVAPSENAYKEISLQEAIVAEVMCQ